MEEDLVDYLLAQAGLTALVGQGITWVDRPQGSALPWVVLHKISAPRRYTNAGSDGLIPARVQCDCWAADALKAKQVGRAVIAALSGATFGGGSGGVSFQAGFVDDEDDGSDEKAGGGRIYRVRVDVILWHQGD